MTSKASSYVRLQRHLNCQAVGFPAIRSGVELKILAHIFTPREAEIATCLSYRPQPLDQVFEKARQWVATASELALVLESMSAKGGIETKDVDGTLYYSNAPLVVGMYEYQLDRLTPEFIKNFDEYTSSRKFGIAFLGTERPQMRTIPVSASITPRHAVSTFDEVKSLMAKAQSPFAICECICRKKKTMKGKICQVTDRTETCLAVGHMAQAALSNGMGRELSLDEALAILEENQKEGLVLQPSNTQKAEFICSCCGCCCGILSMHRHLPIPLDFWATNFHATIDAAKCDGCGKCNRRCQVGAVPYVPGKPPARIDLLRCIGCGLCVPSCPHNAIALVKKNTEIKPPHTREELYDIIMAKKKGPWGNLKLHGKLIYDALRTGKLEILKPE